MQRRFRDLRVEQLGRPAGPRGVRKLAAAAALVLEQGHANVAGERYARRSWALDTLADALEEFTT